MMKKLLALALCLMLCLQPFSAVGFAAVLTDNGLDELPVGEITEDVAPSSVTPVVTDVVVVPPTPGSDPEPVSPQGEPGDLTLVPPQGDPGDLTLVPPQDDPGDPSEGLLTENAVTSQDPVVPPAPSDEQPLPADPAPFAQGYARVLARVEVKLSGGTKAEVASGDLVYADGMDADGALTVWFALPGGDVVKTQLDAALLQPLAEEETEAFLLAAQEAEEDGQAYARTPQGIALPTSGKRLADAPKKLAEDTPTQPTIDPSQAEEVPTPGQSRAVLAISSISANKATSQVGEKITWTMAATGGQAPLCYNFSIYKEGVAVYTGAQSANASIAYTPTTPGFYVAVGVVRDALNATVTKEGGVVWVDPASPLVIQTVTANTTASKVGEKITWTMAASGGVAPLRYNFSIYKDGVAVHTGASSTNATIEYTPTAPGYYVAVGVVRDALNVSATREGGIVRVDPASPLIIQTLTANKTTSKAAEKITWTMTATGGQAPLRYNFSIYKDGVAVYTGAQSANAAIEYTPTAPGYYVAVGVVQDATNALATKEGGIVRVDPAGAPTIQALTANKTTSKVAEKIIWTMTATGGQAPLRYNFSIYKDGVAVYTGAQSANATIEYTPTTPGYYVAVGVVRDAANASATKEDGIVLVQPANPLSVQTVAVSKTNAKVGEMLTWTMTATGGQAPLRYNFTIYKDGVAVHAGAQSANASITYTPTAPGYYVAVGVVRDATNALATKEGGIVLVDPANPLVIQSVTVDKATVKVGDKLTWKITATGGQAPLRYNFSIYKDGVAVYTGAQSASATIEYTPTAPGYYVAVGIVRDAQGASATREGGIALVNPTTPLTIQTLTVNKATSKVGEKLTWTMITTGGQAPLRYNFSIYKDGAVVHTGAQSANATIEYTPTAPGYYVAVGVVRDAQGVTATREGGIVQVEPAAPTNPLVIQALTVSKATSKIGEELTWTMTATGGQAPLRYNFSIYKDGMPVYTGAQSASATVEYTPLVPGYYVVVGVVRDAQGVTVTREGGIANVQLELTLASPSGAMYIGSTATWQVSVGSNMGNATYTYDIYRNGEKIRTVSDSQYTVCTHNMTGDGVYQAVVTIKSGTQALAVASSAYSLVLSNAPSFSAEAYDLGTSSGVNVSTMNLLGATGYRIFRAEYGNPATRIQLAVVSTINSGVSFYSDATPVKGRVYSYSIQPYAQFNGAPVYGAETSAIHVFASALPALQALNQESKTTTTSDVRFAWRAVPGASGYIVERVRLTPAQPPESATQAIQPTSIVWPSMTAGTKHSFNIIPYIDLGGGVLASGATETFTCDVTAFSALTNVTFSQTANTAVQVMWSPLNTTNQPNYALIDAIAIYRSTSATGTFTRVGTVAKNTAAFLDTGLTPGQIYYYTLCAVRDGMPLGDPYGTTITGLYSAFDSFTPQIVQTTVHRALLIGEKNYPNYTADPILEGPDNDINAMGNVLAGMGSAYAGRITKKLNASRQEIFSSITSTFAGATDQDVSLFYFSGHGITSGNYAGALAPADYNGYANMLITAPQLADALNQVRGTVIVILDSCGSGALIYARGADGLEKVEEAPFNPTQFNQAVVNAFASVAPQARTGELISSKFKVLTACANDQQSWTWGYNVQGGNTMYFGHMSYHLTMGAGLVHGTTTVLASAPADTNNNGIITLREAYNYVAPRVSDGLGQYAQTVMMYPTNEEFNLFTR